MALSGDLRMRVVEAVIESGLSRNAAADRIEAHRDYLLGLIRRAPDMTLLEIQERLVANCGERFSSSVLWRFFDRCNITWPAQR